MCVVGSGQPRAYRGLGDALTVAAGARRLVPRAGSRAADPLPWRLRGCRAVLAAGRWETAGGGGRWGAGRRAVVGGPGRGPAGTEPARHRRPPVRRGRADPRAPGPRAGRRARVGPPAPAPATDPPRPPTTP